MVSKLNHDDVNDDNQRRYLGNLDEESTFLTTEETVLLSSDDVVFDNGSTVHIFQNP